MSFCPGILGRQRQDAWAALSENSMERKMNKLFMAVRRFSHDEEGATAVEYGMMVGLIAVAIIVVVAAIGSQLNDLFVKVKDCITTPASCT